MRATTVGTARREAAACALSRRHDRHGAAAPVATPMSDGAVVVERCVCVGSRGGATVACRSAQPRSPLPAGGGKMAEGGGGRGAQQRPARRRRAPPPAACSLLDGPRRLRRRLLLHRLDGSGTDRGPRGRGGPPMHGGVERRPAREAGVPGHPRPDGERRVLAGHDLLDHAPVDCEHAVRRGQPARLGRGRADEPLNRHQPVRHLRHPLHRLVHAEQPRQAGGQLGHGAEGRRRHQEAVGQVDHEHRLGDAVAARETSREDHHAHVVLELV
eukprot:scaffold10144_cov88-Isochrysis_galbana.AAC.2